MMTERDALLAAIYAAPDDDEPRRIYADWLLQEGDPRGEFIQLQLQVAKTTDQLKRERALFVVHSDAWLAELRADPRDAVFERGFLAIARPRGKVLPAERGWATVHTLHEATPRDDVPMPSLRSLRGLTEAHIHELAALRQPLTAHELWWYRPGDAAEEPFPPFVNLTVLPELRRLVMRRGWAAHSERPRQLEWVWTLDWMTKLEELVVSAPISMLRLWIEALDGTRLRTVELRSDYTADWEHMWRCVLGRDDTGKLTRLEAFGWTNPTRAAGASYGHQLQLALGSLFPHTLTSARVVIPRRMNTRWRPEIESWFANQVPPTIELV
jgi:uncharacterized protein (TIGR02996 family)